MAAPLSTARRRRLRGAFCLLLALVLILSSLSIHTPLSLPSTTRWEAESGQRYNADVDVGVDVDSVKTATSLHPDVLSSTTSSHGESSAPEKSKQTEMQRYCSLIAKSTKFEPRCGPAGLPTPRLSPSPDQQQKNPLQFNGTLWPLLITGTGRSGTKYMMKLLKELEFQVAHDNTPPLNDGAVSWVLAFAMELIAKLKSPQSPLRTDGDYPYFAPNLEGGRFIKVMHQVRDPIKSISSRVTNAWLFAEGGFVTRKTAIRTYEAYQKHGHVHGTACIGCALEHWVTWNAFVEEIADYRYRVESVNEDVGQNVILEICAMIEKYIGRKCPSREQVQDAIHRIDDSVNSRMRDYKVEVQKKKVDPAQGAVDKVYSWAELYTENPEMAAIAHGMTLDYGYEVNITQIEEELQVLRVALEVQSQAFAKHTGKKNKMALDFHQQVPERIRPARKACGLGLGPASRANPSKFGCVVEEYYDPT